MKREVDSRGPSESPSEGPSDEELLGLFERRRPRADAFAERVKARIAEREAGPSPDGAGDVSVAPMGTWSKVAALLPLQTTGFKIVPAALAWPLVLLIATLSGAYYWRRSVSKSFDGLGKESVARKPVPVDPEVKFKLSMKWLSGLLYGSMALPLLLGGSWGVDVVLVAALLVMLGFAFIIRDLAANGDVTRQDVSLIATGFLTMFLISGVTMGGSFPGIEAHTGAVRVGALIALLVGQVACCQLAGESHKAKSAVLGGVAVLLLINPFACSGSSPSSVYSELESIGQELKASSLSDWQEAESLHGALLAAGEETPDLAEAATRVSERLADERRVGSGVVSASISMGLLTRGDLSKLALSSVRMLDRLKRKIEKQAAGEEPSWVAAASSSHYDIRLLLATGDLDERSRNALTELVARIWPESGDSQALERALECVQLLELLGRDDMVAVRADSARALLAEHWAPPKVIGWFREAGGFMDAAHRHGDSSRDATVHAVALMGRFGIPDGIDLFLLRGYLRQEAPNSWLRSSSNHSKAEVNAALLRLEGQIGMPQRSWSEWLLAQRLFIVVFLLVLLCISAVWMAPRSIEQILEDEVGALP